jgi:hypothetical protein
MAVLRELGTDKEGRPLALRAAELAERAKVNHHSLTKCTGALLALGQITRCLVQPAKGNKTFEFRIGSGVPASDPPPLDVRRSKVARATHRGAEPLKPMPQTRPRMVPEKTRYTPPPSEPDAGMLARVQGMSEDEFRDYLRHLARVWSWSRAQHLAADAMRGAA